MKLKSRNNLIAKLIGTSWGASASTLRTSALALCYSVAEYCCPVWLDPAAQMSSKLNFIVQCAWFQAACNPRSSHGCQCSAMLHLLLYIVKQQLTICFKSSKPIQIGRCMLMSFTIHLHGLHLDAQYGQTWHLSTQLHSGDRTGRQLVWSATLCYRPYYPIARFRSPSSYMVTDEPFPDRSRPTSC